MVVFRKDNFQESLFQHMVEYLIKQVETQTNKQTNKAREINKNAHTYC